MSLNRYVILGHSGPRVGPFALSGMTFGNDLGRESDVPEAEAVLSWCLEPEATSSSLQTARP
jgi:hypothetical protein